MILLKDMRKAGKSSDRYNFKVLDRCYSAHPMWFTCKLRGIDFLLFFRIRMFAEF